VKLAAIATVGEPGVSKTVTLRRVAKLRR
jgi:hypothetical protein